MAPLNLPAATVTACPSEQDMACYVDGRWSPAAVEKLLQHLDDCAACRVLLDSTMRAIEPVRKESATGGIPRTFAVGEIINGRYRVDRFLNQGGMGEVYEAWDLQLNETIALKTTPCKGRDNAKSSARMRAEVLLGRRVTHPNVCRILEFGLQRRALRNKVEMVPFFTMEYLKGETLAEHIARCGKLPLSEIVQIASQLLDGLSAIHAAGIIHRDLKPENVFLLTTEGGTLRIVVMDFGLARPLDRQSSLMSSEDSSTSGTPAYMAPEQALGTSASTAWDIYAFGVILFRLASGELPFRAINSVALATARLRESAPLLSHVVPGVDPRLETIVSRCLEREPAKRFANVSEIQCAISKINGRERTKPKRRWRLNVPILLASVGLALAVVRSDIQKLSPWRIAPHSPTLTQAPPGGLEPNSSSVGGRSHPIAEDRCVIPAK